MKFAVGVMLTSFGAFWGSEGAGAQWPGDDAALLWLVPAVAVFALALVRVFRAPTEPASGNRAPVVGRGALMIGRRLRAFGAFWYDFVIGDDWRVAVGVAVALAITYVLAHHGHAATWWLILVAIGLLLPSASGA